MTPEERHGRLQSLWKRVMSHPIDSAAAVSEEIHQNTKDLDREEVIDIVGTMLADALDIGAVLATAIERYPEAEREAFQLRERLEFRRITSKIYDDQ